MEAEVSDLNFILSLSMKWLVADPKHEKFASDLEVTAGDYCHKDAWASQWWLSAG